VRAQVRRLSARVSACIEWLFAEGGGPFPERVRAAAAAGIGRIEFWNTGDKDLHALERAIDETGVTVSAFVTEPRGRLVDPSTHAAFLKGVAASGELARRLNACGLIVLSGDARPDVPRREQRDAIVEALRRAGPLAAEAGIRLFLEPLNTLVDHKGYFLDSTEEALEIVAKVGDPAVSLLYDMYHSIVMGEDPAEVLDGAGELVGHVHVADVPGRHEPGTGAVDWPRQLAALRAAGYSGAIGLEYLPSGDTESSLAYISGLVAQSLD
jgi:hydroxypyruvate isomerase